MNLSRIHSEEYSEHRIAALAPFLVSWGTAVEIVMCLWPRSALLRLRELLA